MVLKSHSPIQPPDRYAPERLNEPKRFTVRWMAQVHSTNTALKALAQSGASEGFCLCADEQTAGRGQYGRVWHSPAGAGLYLSLLFRPDLTRDDIAHVTTFAGLVVHHVLTRFVGNQSRLAIKPPNDVFLDCRKVAGILVEADWRQDALNFLVIGIGVNISQLSFPDGLTYPATSLRLALGDAAPTREAVLRHILEVFDNQWDSFVSEPSEFVDVQRKGVVFY